MKTCTSTEPVEYLTILDELNNVTRTPVSDNSNYYTMITKKVVTTQEERYKSLDCTKLTSDSNYTTLIKTQEERYKSLDCTKLTSDSNYTTLIKTQEERYQSLDCTKLTSDSNYTTLMK